MDEVPSMNYVFNDGGRSNYFQGTGGDCVARALAINNGVTTGAGFHYIIDDIFLNGFD